MPKTLGPTLVHLVATDVTSRPNFCSRLTYRGVSESGVWTLGCLCDRIDFSLSLVTHTAFRCYLSKSSKLGKNLRAVKTARVELRSLRSVKGFF